MTSVIATVKGFAAPTNPESPGVRVRFDWYATPESNGVGEYAALANFQGNAPVAISERLAVLLDDTINLTIL